MNEFKPKNGIVIPTETATTVPYLDANKKLVSSAVTPTELGYVSGVTSSIQTQISAKEASANKGQANGYASLDANGLVPTTQLPAASLERMVVVADQTARYALTTASVQNGDTVYQTDTATMYMVKDDTNLSNSSGYQSYSAGTSVNFSGSLSGDISGTQGATAYNGTVPLNKGGTGQTTKAAAFDALSPMTAAGDLIYGGTSGTGTKLSIGSSGQVLKTVGGVPTWATFSGGINYLSSNPDAEADTSGWTTFADAASSTPTDGTGGSPNSTWTRTTSSPLRGSASFLFTKSTGASRQGEGVSYDFTIDSADKGKVLQGSFDYAIASGTYVDEDMSVWVYDVTNAVMIQPAPSKIKITNINSKFGFEFQTSSDSTSYRFIIYVNASTESSCTLKFDNFNIGPQAKLYGSPITDAVAYTPTFTGFGTVSNINVKSQRIGDSLRVFGYFQTGTNTGVEARMTLGYGGSNANVNIDTSKIGNTIVIGSAGSTESASTTYFGMAPLSGTTNYIKWGRQTSTATITAAALGNAWTNSVYISFDLIVPILGWQSQTVMSNDASTQVVAASYYLTSNLTINTTATDITGWSLITDTHGMFNTTTGVCTYPVAGKYRIGFTGQFDTGGSAATQHVVNFVTGGTTYIVNAATDLAASKSYNYSPSLIVSANAGQTFKVQGRSVTNSSTAIGSQCYITIERISGPSQILATDNVSALYTGAPPTGTLTNAYNVTTFGTKRKDTHNAYSGGTFTVPESGTYSIQAQARHDATYSAGNTAGIALFINGVQYETGVENAGGVEVSLWPCLIAHSVPLLAGDLVTIRSYNNGTSPVFVNNSNQSFFSIVRTGNY